MKTTSSVVKSPNVRLYSHGDSIYEKVRGITTPVPTMVPKEMLRKGEVYRYELDGVPHREDGPAIKYSIGVTVWYWHGKIHREDGPAVEWKDGTREWYLHGELHREDGPAIEHYDGTKEWYMHGKLHNDHGPAILGEENAWYVRNGKLRRHPSTMIWYQNGKLHREGGPAVTLPDGTREWWIHGNLHRDDGPAILRKQKWYVRGEPRVYDITEIWYQNGKLHREGGAAVNLPDGTREWWIHGTRTG